MHRAFLRSVPRLAQGPRVRRPNILSPRILCHGLSSEPPPEKPKGALEKFRVTLRRVAAESPYAAVTFLVTSQVVGVTCLAVTMGLVYTGVVTVADATAADFETGSSSDGPFAGLSRVVLPVLGLAYVIHKPLLPARLAVSAMLTPRLTPLVHRWFDGTAAGDHIIRTSNKLLARILGDSDADSKRRGGDGRAA